MEKKLLHNNIQISCLCQVQ